MDYQPTIYGQEPQIRANAAVHVRCARHPQDEPSSQGALDYRGASIAVLWCPQCPEDDNALARFTVPALF